MNVVLDKGRLGMIGENMVQTKLMQLGLNVINANVNPLKVSAEISGKRYWMNWGIRMVLTIFSKHSQVL